MAKYFKKTTEKFVMNMWKACTISDLVEGDIFREKMGRKILATYRFLGYAETGEIKYLIIHKK
jgi:hypothetical protein